MDTLYAGHYVGEFGWELCWWNPMVRHHVKQRNETTLYPKIHVTIAAPESSRYLYEFADTFIPLQAKGITYWKGKLKGSPPVVHADFYLTPETEFLKHKNEPDRISTERLWRELSPDHPVYQADVLCAFRPGKYNGKKRIPGKEYPINKCQKIVDSLIAQGLSVACFGGMDNYCPDGAMDLRGQSLEEQCSAISAAKCVVGPSSGPIHLASLCKCPHVTWIASIHHTLKERYEKLWNPFDTPVKFICDNRLPPPVEVVQNVKALIGKDLI